MCATVQQAPQEPELTQRVPRGAAPQRWTEEYVSWFAHLIFRVVSKHRAVAGEARVSLLTDTRPRTRKSLTDYMAQALTLSNADHAMRWSVLVPSDKMTGSACPVKAVPGKSHPKPFNRWRLILQFRRNLSEGWSCQPEAGQNRFAHVSHPSGGWWTL